MTGQSRAIEQVSNWRSKTANILKLLKIYILLHFLSNYAQIYRKCSLQYNKKTRHVGILLILRNKNFMTKIEKNFFFFIIKFLFF